MTDEQYKEARRLQWEMDAVKRNLENLYNEPANPLNLPEEMCERHFKEKENFLKAQLAALEKSFSML